MPTIAVLLTQGFADWEYALIGGTGGPFHGVTIWYVTPTPGVITSQGGLQANVRHSVDYLEDLAPDAIAVIGGTIWETPDAPDLSGLLRAHHDRGATIAGICGGTLALARAGLLDQVPHTSNDPTFLSTHGGVYQGAAQYKTSARAVSADRIITAPGTAPVSFAAALFRAVGVDDGQVDQLEKMLAAEHIG